MRGRGTSDNPQNRFESFAYERDEDADEISPQTVVLKDATRTIIATNDSPDVGFESSINPYRGCEHGCVYCYARPTHEYLSLSAGLDFETKILAKFDAPKLLRKELSAKKWVPKILAMSGVTDPYQPVERKLKITRGCLEVLNEFKNPVCIVTKNHMVTRDIDLLSELAKDNAAAVFVSITTLDPKLAGVMEPRTSQPRARLEAISKLRDAGVPVGVMMAPVIPGLTDHEMPGLLAEAVRAGAGSAGYVILRLPYGVEALFQNWLDENFPDRKEKILNRLRDMRGGKLNDSRFGERMGGKGAYADQIAQIFDITTRKLGIAEKPLKLTATNFRNPNKAEQLALF